MLLGKTLQRRHVFLCRGHNRGEEGAYWWARVGGGLETKEKRQRMLRKCFAPWRHCWDDNETIANPCPFFSDWHGGNIRACPLSVCCEGKDNNNHTRETIHIFAHTELLFPLLFFLNILMLPNKSMLYRWCIKERGKEVGGGICCRRQNGKIKELDRKDTQERSNQ